VHAETAPVALGGPQHERTPVGWRDTTIPSRIAGLIHAFAEQSQPLPVQTPQSMLCILDRLVDMGDRRSAALQTSEIFKDVTGSQKDNEFEEALSHPWALEVRYLLVCHRCLSSSLSWLVGAIWSQQNGLRSWRSLCGRKKMNRIDGKQLSARF
jgi:hypothetical protein